MQFVLEKQKFFPYVAWTIVVGFGAFTFLLAVQLTETAGALGEQTQNTVSAIENGV